MSTHCVMTIMFLIRKVYKLGDKVRVRVADADKMLKTVDFELVADIWNDEEEN